MNTLENVLAHVNALREEHNIGEPLTEMPRGYPKNCFGCPIAQALSTRKGLAQVGITSALIGLDGTTVELHPVLTDFIFAFDAGEYPELLADAYND